MDFGFHLYTGMLHSETALPFSAPKNCDHQQKIKGRGENADTQEEKLVKQGDFGSYVGQCFPAGRGADNTLDFQGKVKTLC